MRSSPDDYLVGLDTLRDEVLVSTGQRNRVVTASELAKVVSLHIDSSPDRDEVDECEG